MTPEFEAFRKQWESAVPQGLAAAAAIYHGAVRAKLEKGYTTGDFVTGNAASSVQMSPTSGASRSPNGWEVVVGSNEMYTLYWELGHWNLFTRRYERVEHWQRAIDENAPAMAEAFGGRVSVVLETGQ